MLSGAAELEKLLDQYEDHSGMCKKLLRTYAAEDPEKLLACAREMVINLPPCNVLKYLTDSIGSEGIVRIILDTYSQSREAGIALAKKLYESNSRVEAMLLEPLQRNRFTDAAEDIILQLLDILDEISEGDRLVLNILPFLKHPNFKFQSKAVLFIGKRKPNLRWITDHSNDLDPRVRANILESMHGTKNDIARRLFTDNIADENNRVAGNAILGLYLLGDPRSIGLIDKMARDHRPEFRNTSAWIMGRTGDRRFGRVLSELISDTDAVVRKQALRGLGGLKNALKMAARTPIHVSAFPVRSSDQQQSVIATLHDESGQPLREVLFTSFLLKRDGRYLAEYSVEEYDRADDLDVAFILCLPQADETAAHRHLQAIVERCLPLRRSKDRWAIVTLTGKGETGGAPSPEGSGKSRDALLFSSNPSAIHAMLRDAPILVNGSAEDKATRDAIYGMANTFPRSVSPHLIFLGAGPSAGMLDAVVGEKSDPAPVIHVLAQTSAWQDRHVQSVVESTGGIYKQVAPLELSQECLAVCSSLLHHYRLTWTKGDGPVELEIFSTAGAASIPLSMHLADPVN